MTAHSEQDGLKAFLGGLAADAALWTDFLTLCDFGGRLAGTPSEAAALAWAEARLSAVPGATLRVDRGTYPGWRCRTARVTDCRSGRELACAPLLGTASTPTSGIEADVVDLGRGTPEQFEIQRDALAGRIVMVRHEYPFAAGHVHRRAKLQLAQERGAAGFLIVQPLPGVGPVSGSSGRGGGAGIPALGISAEAAGVLTGTPGEPARARLHLDGEDRLEELRTLLLDLPSAGAERIVISAHIDGHPLGESAIDNASGVAVALALARAIAPHISHLPRGLTICLFSAEEWGLAGSRIWLGELPASERARMVLNINLDSVAGDARLTALTSGFIHLGPFVQAAAAAVSLPLGVYPPLMPNSDHANFAGIGIPALRLVAGFGQSDSSLRFLLTAADTRDKVAPIELKGAVLTAGAVLWSALTAPTPDIMRLRVRARS